MAYTRYSDVSDVVSRQFRQQGHVDIVRRERFGVLTKTLLFQPSSDVRHFSPVPGEITPKSGSMLLQEGMTGSSLDLTVMLIPG